MLAPSASPGLRAVPPWRAIAHTGVLRATPWIGALLALCLIASAVPPAAASGSGGPVRRASLRAAPLQGAAAVARPTARYPLTVDPALSTLATLSAPTALLAGFSVALSADGGTALIGAPAANGNAGLAYIFLRPATGWTDSGSPVATLSVPGSQSLGSAVALSADGGTVLIGAPDTNAAAGAAYIFARPAGGWSDRSVPNATLAATTALQLGAAVALSGDGATAVAGAPGALLGAGSVYVFTRSGAGWAGNLIPTATLSAPGALQFGQSVSTSAGGETVLVGAPGSGGGAGAAYVFVRPDPAWSDTGVASATLTAPGSAALGGAVALSADATVAAIGIQGGVSGSDAVYLFTEPAGGWIRTPAGPVVLSGPTGGDFGEAVGLSADGNLLLVGDDSTDTASLFARPSGNWSPAPAAGATYTAQGVVGTPPFPVAMSGDGATAIAGSPFLNDFAGAAFVFRPSSQTTLGASANPALIGTSVTFSAAVSAVAPGGQPTGTVTFLDTFNGLTTTLAVVAVVGGTASLSTAALAPGTHRISAVYGGDAAFSPSDASLTLPIVRGCSASVALVTLAGQHLGIEVITIAGLALHYISYAGPEGGLVVRDAAVTACANPGTAAATVTIAGHVGIARGSLAVRGSPVTAVVQAHNGSGVPEVDLTIGAAGRIIRLLPPFAGQPIISVRGF